MDEVNWPCIPSPSYNAFITKFGNACLYRELSYYLIRVFSKPRQQVDKKGEEFFEFGGYDSGDACFKTSLLVEGRETPIFETRGVTGLFQTATSFGEWLESRAVKARKRYKRSEWKQILAGPLPFTEVEQDIVKARSQFKWQVVGITENGDLKFEVTNNSKRVLPFLTIGIRAPKLLGGIWLPVATILPGRTKIIQASAYKEQADPDTIEAFDEPEPWPEDRDRYWEFRKPDYL
jgi:hypothetical protein